MFNFANAFWVSIEMFYFSPFFSDSNKLRCWLFNFYFWNNPHWSNYMIFLCAAGFFIIFGKFYDNYYINWVVIYFYYTVSIRYKYQCYAISWKELEDYFFYFMIRNSFDSFRSILSLKVCGTIVRNCLAETVVGEGGSFLNISVTTGLFKDLMQMYFTGNYPSQLGVIFFSLK